MLTCKLCIMLEKIATVYIETYLLWDIKHQVTNIPLSILVYTREVHPLKTGYNICMLLPFKLDAMWAHFR